MRGCGFILGQCGSGYIEEEPWNPDYKYKKTRKAIKHVTCILSTQTLKKSLADLCSVHSLYLY